MGRAVAAVALATLVLAGVSAAAWSTAVSGTGTSRARVLGAGPAPTAGTITGTLTKNVPLSWTPVPGAAGYVLRRYTGSGLPSVIGGTCVGLIAATSCIDQNVAPGQTWLYTVQPANGLWLGSEGPATSVTT